MWICPKCNENIEDQFDSCWKCAGAAQPKAPTQDLAWMYPVISVASSLGLGCFIGLFWHNPKWSPGYFDLGGALLGVIISLISIWAFMRCPMRHWIAKTLTLLFLVYALYCGVLTVGSFVIHVLGYDAA